MQLPKDVVIDPWKSGSPRPILQELAVIVRAGYQAILANGPSGEWVGVKIRNQVIQHQLGDARLFFLFYFYLFGFGAVTLFAIVPQ